MAIEVNKEYQTNHPNCTAHIESEDKGMYVGYVLFKPNGSDKLQKPGDKKVYHSKIRCTWDKDGMCINMESNPITQDQEELNIVFQS